MNKTLLRIAFADDDQDDHLFFFRAVQSYYTLPIIDCFLNTEDFLNFYLKGGEIIPHIIFLDKNMPDNSDYECLVKIKSAPLLAAIPVIIYSTSMSDEDSRLALKRGAGAFITKPVGFNDTVKTLKAVIGEFVKHTIEAQTV